MRFTKSTLFLSFRLLTPFILGLYFASCNPGTFDLNIQLRSSQQHPVVYRGSQVMVQFGQRPPEAPQPLTEDGRAVFPKLSRGLLQDTVRLTYIAKNQRPYRVTQQMFYTAADADGRPIDFVVEILPDTTHMQFTLKNKDGVIPHALIKIDNKLTVESDDYGMVDVYVAKTAGSSAHFIVEKDGKVLMDKEVVVSDEFQKLLIDQQ